MIWCCVARLAPNRRSICALLRIRLSPVSANTLRLTAKPCKRSFAHFFIDEPPDPRLPIGHMEPLTLCLTDVSRRIGVKKRTLYNMIGDGRFPVPPIPRTRPRRWSVEAVDAWVRGEV